MLLCEPILDAAAEAQVPRPPRRPGGARVPSREAGVEARPSLADDHLTQSGEFLRFPVPQQNGILHATAASAPSHADRPLRCRPSAGSIASDRPGQQPPPTFPIAL